MPKTTITTELLREFAQKLTTERERFDKITQSMNVELFSKLLWDDPVAQKFKAQYEEGLAPVKKKLLPALDKYQLFLKELARRTEVYAEVNTSKANIGTFVTAGAATFGVIGGAAATTKYAATSKSGGTITNGFENCKFEPKEWMTWDEKRKVAELGKCKDAIINDLNITNKPQLKIEKIAVKPGIFTNGYYDPKTNEIVINQEILNRDPGFVAQTLGHEMRHAWQNTGENVPEIYKDNLKNYISVGDPVCKPIPPSHNPKVCTFEDYKNQPVEVDADKYGEMIKNLVYKPSNSGGIKNVLS